MDTGGVLKWRGGARGSGKKGMLDNSPSRRARSAGANPWPVTWGGEANRMGGRRWSIHWVADAGY